MLGRFTVNLTLFDWRVRGAVSLGSSTVNLQLSTLIHSEARYRGRVHAICVRVWTPGVRTVAVGKWGSVDDAGFLVPRRRRRNKILRESNFLGKSKFSPSNSLCAGTVAAQPFPALRIYSRTAREPASKRLLKRFLAEDWGYRSKCNFNRPWSRASQRASTIFYRSLGNGRSSLSHGSENRMSFGCSAFRHHPFGDLFRDELNLER